MRPPAHGYMDDTSPAHLSPALGHTRVPMPADALLSFFPIKSAYVVFRLSRGKKHHIFCYAECMVCREGRVLNLLQGQDRHGAAQLAARRPFKVLRGHVVGAGYPWTYKMLRGPEGERLVEGTRVVDFEGLVERWRRWPLPFERRDHVVERPLSLLDTSQMRHAATTPWPKGWCKSACSRSASTWTCGRRVRPSGASSQWMTAWPVAAAFGRSGDDRVFYKPFSVEGVAVAPLSGIVADMCGADGPCVEAADLLTKKIRDDVVWKAQNTSASRRAVFFWRALASRRAMLFQGPAFARHSVRSVSLPFLPSRRPRAACAETDSSPPRNACASVGRTLRGMGHMPYSGNAVRPSMCWLWQEGGGAVGRAAWRAPPLGPRPIPAENPPRPCPSALRQAPFPPRCARRPHRSLPSLRRRLPARGSTRGTPAWWIQSRTRT